MSTVQITIDKFGRPTIKGNGISGPACKEHLAVFAKAAGGEQSVSDTEEMSAITTTEDETQHQTSSYGY
jgi:hypothetical protein